MRRPAVLALLLAALLLAALSLGTLTLAAPLTASANVRPRTTLPDIERQVMCVTCKIPLEVAESPQADRERAFIQELIDRGEDEAQIKQALVGQYGPTVLGLPSAHGFDLTAYLVPALVVLALLALLALLLPRWRRRARSEGALPTAAPARSLSEADVARLESDLARFD